MSSSAQLQRLTVDTLRALCRHTGITGVPTRKAEIAATLARHLDPFQPPVPPLTKSSPPPPIVLSVDVGYKNLAWACIQGPRVLAWHRTSIIDRGTVPMADGTKDGLPSRIYDPQLFARGVHSAVGEMQQQLVRAIPSSHPGSVYAVVERQRTMGPAQGSMTVFMVNAVEAMLWAALLHPTLLPSGVDLHARSLPPGQVSGWFALKGEGKSKNKKANAVGLVTRLLASPHCFTTADQPGLVVREMVPPYLVLPADARAGFVTAGKQDDMADALLQALAYQDWMANSRRLAGVLAHNGVISVDECGQWPSWRRRLVLG
ncbi:hypothetical protein BC828DRAFT_376101 [Blastocladiella britannica]|nr:hypothetical protein BC828DRAFT_376101 [Blastocladiella britannica]